MIKAIKKLFKKKSNIEALIRQLLAINAEPETYIDRDCCLVFVNKLTGRAMKIGNGEIYFSDKQDDDGYYVFGKAGKM